jgi:hypothetical protein
MTEPVKTPREILEEFKWACYEGYTGGEMDGIQCDEKDYQIALAQLEEYYKPLEPIDGVPSVEEIEKALETGYKNWIHGDSFHSVCWQQAQVIHNLIIQRRKG